MNKKLLSILALISILAMNTNSVFADEFADFLSWGSSGTTSNPVATPSSTGASNPVIPNSETTSPTTNTTPVNAIEVTDLKNENGVYSFTVKNFDKDYRLEIQGKGTFDKKDFVSSTEILWTVTELTNITVANTVKDLQGWESIEGEKIYLASPNTLSLVKFTIKNSVPLRIVKYVNRDTNQIEEIKKLEFPVTNPVTEVPTNTTPVTNTNPLVPNEQEQTQKDLIAYVNKLKEQEANKNANPSVNQNIQSAPTPVVNQTPVVTKANTTKNTGVKENFMILFAIALLGILSVPYLRRKGIV